MQEVGGWEGAGSRRKGRCRRLEERKVQEVGGGEDAGGMRRGRCRRYEEGLNEMFNKKRIIFIFIFP